MVVVYQGHWDCRGYSGCWGYSDYRTARVLFGFSGICGSFRKLGVPYFEVLIIRILLFGVLY